MDRLRSGLLVAAVAVGLGLVAGCGGGGDERAGCDDAAFRNQSEELYVAIATAQNAASSSAGAPGVKGDLEKGAAVLRTHVEEHRPCDDRLESLWEAERAALERLDAAIAALASGESASADLEAAIEELGRVEVALRESDGDEGAEPSG